MSTSHNTNKTNQYTMKLHLRDLIFEKDFPKDESQPKSLNLEHFTHRATPMSSKYNDARPLWSATTIFRNVFPPYKNANIVRNP